VIGKRSESADIISLESRIEIQIHPDHSQEKHKMFYLAIQTLFWIVMAVIFGVFVGWLLWKPSAKNIQMEIDDLHRKISNRENKIISLRTDLDQCRATLKVYKAEMEEVCRPGIVPPLPDSVPSARAFEADDLKLISGVGPALEGKLNALNIYTYEQVAALTPEVVGKLGDTLESIADHIIKEDWVGQAQKILSTKTRRNGNQHSE
jgi:predicted flap endonuclease-1-like 5' DNA nuclease